ncbi:TPA: 16S rRNA (cytosine(1402)-N(4))-methyltransferase RsmH [Candidatus Poribacteria bacterium]|nr:16S rRNA (cytosine(1402)-N(4))-methyltransferase RsmH [Candidatus Poribacteria bacterium]
MVKSNPESLWKQYIHTPVLKKEVIQYIQPRSRRIYLDCTVGLGGHASAILENSSPDGRLIGIDLDKEAIAIAKKNLSRFQNRVTLIHGNFAHLDKILQKLDISSVDGILMDLGVSSLQLETPQRGFSFLKSGSLDMRMDRNCPSSAKEGESSHERELWVSEENIVTAERELNTRSKEELTEIFYKFGEERWADRIASEIVKARAKQPILNTLQLVDIIKRAIPQTSRQSKIHPATRVFQALRIHVNQELDNLEFGLKHIVKALRPGGVICAISFHSLEDRIIKQTFRFLSRKCICPPRAPICMCNHKPSLKLLTPKPIIPQSEEIQQNPRARSAKLRAAMALL